MHKKLAPHLFYYDLNVSIYYTIRMFWFHPVQVVVCATLEQLQQSPYSKSKGWVQKTQSNKAPAQAPTIGRPLLFHPEPLLLWVGRRPLLGRFLFFSARVRLRPPAPELLAPPRSHRRRQSNRAWRTLAGSSLEGTQIREEEAPPVHPR
jgi:hypothetical protein